MDAVPICTDKGERKVVQEPGGLEFSLGILSELKKG